MGYRRRAGSSDEDVSEGGRSVPRWVVAIVAFFRRLPLPLWAVAIVLLPVVAIVAGVLLLVVGILTYSAFSALHIPPIVPAMVAVALVVFVRRHRQARAAAGDPTPQVPGPDEAWTAARARFATLRSAYAAHECDAMAVLRLPALSDVAVPSTARFVDAYAEAQTLETDAFPGAGHAASFVRAVEHAERAWRSAREAAERIRLSALGPDERAAVERVLKLLTTARESDSEPERLSAYAFARAELEKLDRAGVIHMPPTARAALETAGRRQLPA